MLEDGRACGDGITTTQQQHSPERKGKSRQKQRQESDETREVGNGEGSARGGNGRWAMGDFAEVLRHFS